MDDFFQVIKIKEKVFGLWLRIAKCDLQTVLSLTFHEMCPICRTAGSTEKLELHSALEMLWAWNSVFFSLDQLCFKLKILKIGEFLFIFCFHRKEYQKEKIFLKKTTHTQYRKLSLVLISSKSWQIPSNISKTEDLTVYLQGYSRKEDKFFRKNITPEWKLVIDLLCKTYFFYE